MKKRYQHLTVNLTSRLLRFFKTSDHISLQQLNLLNCCYRISLDDLKMTLDYQPKVNIVARNEIQIVSVVVGGNLLVGRRYLWCETNI